MTANSRGPFQASLLLEGEEAQLYPEVADSASALLKQAPRRQHLTFCGTNLPVVGNTGRTSVCPRCRELDAVE
jgi:hypothetical protein